MSSGVIYKQTVIVFLPVPSKPLLCICVKQQEAGGLPSTQANL